MIALPTFVKAFGLAGNPTHQAQVSGNVVSILQGGAFFGALGGAPTEDYLGRKWALIVGCVIFIVGAIVQTVASSSVGQSEPQGFGDWTRG